MPLFEAATCWKQQTPQLTNRKEVGGGVQIVLFSEVTPFEDNDSTILLAMELW